MKICKTCKTEKPICDFGKRAASKDGLAHKCRVCQSKYDKARLKDPERMKMRRDYQKTEGGKEAHARACKRWREKNPIKRAVHMLTGSAIRSGKLIRQPCEVCKDNKTAGHHDDYAFPLVVRWLCAVCHSRWHRVNGSGKNAF